MSACLITISGTSGTIKLNYTIGLDNYSIETSIGDFYIEDTATDVTYTTLEGDLTADSLCLTVTELPTNCYTISWNNINTSGYVINAIILGTTILSTSLVNFPNSSTYLTSAINNLYDDRVKVIGYKFSTGSISYPYDNSYIFRVIGTDVPILRLYNSVSNTYLYIHGVSSDCVLSGYTQVVPCYTASIPITTTTSTSTTTTTTTTASPPVTPSYFNYSIVIISDYIVDSTGNANPALDGLIFLEYRVSPSNNLVTHVYTSPQTVTPPCSALVELYYYKNDVKVDISSAATIISTC